MLIERTIFIKKIQNNYIFRVNNNSNFFLKIYEYVFKMIAKKLRSI